ncbi:hypothetical protein DIPPA_24873 [Diplonema papillatum]|nr:hypothetical protein DIPPA_24873 [Diplonema papillatum]
MHTRTPHRVLLRRARSAIANAREPADGLSPQRNSGEEAENVGWLRGSVEEAVAGDQVSRYKGSAEYREQLNRGPYVKDHAEEVHYTKMEHLYPPKEGYRTTEDYLYTWGALPEEVRREKEEVLQRYFGVPRSGVINRWGPEQYSEIEQATFNMTRKGQEAFLHRARLAYVNEGISVKEALKKAKDDDVSYDYYRRRAEGSQILQEMRESPYYDDPELREGAGSSSDVRTKAHEIFATENLVVEDTPAARRELLKTEISVPAMHANPLRFFVHANFSQLKKSSNALKTYATRASWAKDEAKREAQREKAQIRRAADVAEETKEQQDAADIDAQYEAIFGEAPPKDEPEESPPEAETDPGTTGGVDHGVIRLADGTGGGPKHPWAAPLRPRFALAAGERPATVPTPDSLREHALRVEERVAEKRAALRQKNLEDLFKPKPITSTIPGGDYSVASAINQAQMAMGDDAVARHYTNAKISGSSQPQKDDPFQYDRRALMRCVKAVQQHAADARDDLRVAYYEGRKEHALDGLVALSREVAGAAELPAVDPVDASKLHPWHAHCIKLSAKMLVDEALRELQEGSLTATQAKLRESIRKHESEKLDKLTASLGKSFHHDFWAAATQAPHELAEGRKRFEKKLLASRSPQVVMGVSLQSDPAVVQIRDDYMRYISEVTRVARELDSGHEWAALDSYVGGIVSGAINLSFEKHHFDIASQLLPDPTPLIEGFQQFTRGILLFSWAGALMRRARVSGLNSEIDKAAGGRQQALSLLSLGQAQVHRFGVMLESPSRQDFWVAPDAFGNDGSAHERVGNHAGAAEWYRTTSNRGLPADTRDYVACLLRYFQASAADHVTLQMMRNLEKSPGAPVLFWRTRSTAQRAVLWHRYMGSANLWLLRAWETTSHYSRARQLARQCLDSAMYHYGRARAGGEGLMRTPDTEAEASVTACVEASELFECAFARSNDSATTLGWDASGGKLVGLFFDEAGQPLGADGIKAVVAERQQRALASLAAAEASLGEQPEADATALARAKLIDNDAWVGTGRAVHWRAIITSDSVQHTLWGAGCRSGDAGDIEVWYSQYQVMEKLYSEAEEGAEKAYVAARMALVLHQRPCFTVEERNASLDDAAEKAGSFFSPRFHDSSQGC